MKKLLSEAFGLKCVGFDLNLEEFVSDTVRIRFRVQFELDLAGGEPSLPKMSGPLSRLFDIVDYDFSFSSMVVIGEMPKAYVNVTLYPSSHGVVFDVFGGVAKVLVEVSKLKELTYDSK